MLSRLARVAGLRAPTWGDWAHLAHVREAPRYAAIEALRLAYAPDAAVLDLGCGTGLVRQHLTTPVSYLGIELQRTAAWLGHIRIRDPRHRIVQGDLAHVGRIGRRRFGVILFNEVLYYQPSEADALDILRRYSHILTADGIWIISIAVDPDRPARMNNRVWTAVTQHYAAHILTTQTVACDDRPTWQMAVIRP